MERREFSGAVEETSLTSSISDTDLSITVDDGSSYPDGSVNPFVIVINKGMLTEEKVLCSSRVANVISASQRGYDGTSASAHSAGQKVDHVLDAAAAQSMNTVTFDNNILIWSGIGG